MLRKTKDVDQEIGYKQAFRVFYKDSSGCVPAEELKFVLRNLRVRKADGQRSQRRKFLPFLLIIYIDVNYKNPSCSLLDFRGRNRGNDPEG